MHVVLELNMQTLNSDDNDKPIDQPTNTINNLVSFSSLSSPILHDTISKLEEIFHTKTDSTAEPARDTTFHSLAKGTQSAAAQSRASVHKVASSSNSGFPVKLNGKVVTAKPKPQTVPQKESFDFSLKPTRASFSSSEPTKSAWSDSYQQAIGISLLDPKGRDSSDNDDDYDLPLSKRLHKRAEEKSVLSSASEMEEDSVDECLQGYSVVDLLVPEQLNAAGASLHNTTANAQDAPADIIQPAPKAMSSAERVDQDNSSAKDASTPASLFWED